MCSPQEQLSIAFDTYYQGQNKVATACDFGGAASVVQAAKQSSGCSAALASASAVSGGSGSGSGGSSGSAGSGGAAATTTGKNDAGRVMVGPSLGGLWVGSALAVFGGMMGVGMILL